MKTNINIVVDAKPADISQEEYSRIKRVSNVLIAAGHQVRILWGNNPTVDVEQRCFIDNS